MAAPPPPAPVPHAAAPQPAPPSATRIKSGAPDNTLAALQLALAALTIALLFGVVLVAPLPLWAGQPVGPPQRGAEPASAVGWPGLVIALVLVMGLCLPFRPYRHALDAASRLGPKGTGVLLSLTAALALVAVLIYPRFGSDIFDYVGFERTWVVYGENPLVGTPASHPADWATPLVWYADQPPAYGPLWAILTWPIVRLAGDSPSLAVAGYKILSVAAYALCCALIWRLVEPPRQKRALVLFAWSPLVLFEVLGKVHNDVVIAVGVLGALWLVQHGHDRPSLPTAVGTALVKVTALAVAPPIVLRLWRSGGWRALLPAALGAVVLIGLVYAPFWAGTATLQPLLHQTSRVVWSPGTLLMILSSALPGPIAATSLVRVLLVGVWLASCVLTLRRARLETAAEVAASSGRLLLSSVLLLTTAVFGHYLIPAVALAAVSADARLEQWVFWLSIGGLAAYAVELLALVFGPEWIGSLGYQLAGSLVLLAPAALATLRSPARSSALT